MPTVMLTCSIKRRRFAPRFVSDLLIYAGLPLTWFYKVSVV